MAITKKDLDICYCAQIKVLSICQTDMKKMAILQNVPCDIATLDIHAYCNCTPLNTTHIIHEVTSRHIKKYEQVSGLAHGGGFTTVFHVNQ